ncbi:MAG: PilC/PilY family type IV pilus protein [Sideroxydans sp.]|nr:PilC/PilY family type IV pilus protein [Sideroxydans sp.]
MFIIDNSGSMDWEYMPDSVNNNKSKFCYRNNYYNGVYYNPDLTYKLPIKSDGTYYPNSNFTAAVTNGFLSTSTTNLSSQFKTGSDSTGQAAYYYKYTGTSPATPVRGTCYPDSSYTKVVVSSTSSPAGTDERQNFANWYTYYRDRLATMKSSAGLAFSNLTTDYRVGLMKISQTDPVIFVDTFTGTTAGTQRYDWYEALYGITTSGSTPLRRALANAGRYYAGQLSGADPMQYSCQQNFTILSTDGFWNGNTPYMIDGTTPVGNQDGTAGRPMFDGAQSGTSVTTTYTRNTYSKTGTKISGLGGSNCSSNKKRIVITEETKTCTVIGGVTTCTAAVAGTKSYMSPYTSNNSTCVSSNSISTPSSDPWVAGSSVTSTGSSGGTSDTLADVAMYYYQTDLRTSALNNCTGSVSGEDVCKNNVFIGSNDSNTQQHMTTFTLGLGASGQMTYSPSYLSDSDPTSAYVAVKLGSTASATVCPWQTAGTTCNWPEPVSNTLTTIDDLWHAAVNGRGAYFSAEDPSTLASGLSQALAGINSRKGAAAAAATSTLNPVAGNNFAFVASYTTLAWKGNLEARGINTDSGEVSKNATWCVQDVLPDTCSSPGTIVASSAGDTTVYNCVTPNSVVCNGGILEGTDCKIQVATACTGTMNALISSNSDLRTIVTPNIGGTGLIDFDYASLSASQQSYFDAANIGTLSQWSLLSATQQAAASGANLVNYLRGQTGYEKGRSTNPPENQLFRYREAVLGDALESQPMFSGAPPFSYIYPGYAAFKTNHANREGTVYMGANDGMMHAFDAATGVERWAYVPSMVLPNLWKLADEYYSTKHVNYVNGSPIIADVCVSGCTSTSAVWKTILVAGLNAGGRGAYTLDVTDPTSPVLLWEFTPSTGKGIIKDDDIGYVFGRPVITRLNDANGTWVVLIASGYNNTNPGSGLGYLYVLNANTGTIISKIATTAGNSTSPSGLGKIAGFNVDPTGNLASYVYGGDLEGNLWRFDINSSAGASIGTGDVLKFATLFSDASGTIPQPITTTPILGMIDGKRYVYISTGKYLEPSDLSTTQIHSFYSIQDDDATSTLVNPRNSLLQQTLSTNASNATRTSTNNTASASSYKGCFVDFPDTGERANVDGDLVQGQVIVPTIIPSNTACTPGGYGWLNFFDYKNCSGKSSLYGSTIVGVNVVFINGVAVPEVVTSTNPTPTADPNLIYPQIPMFSGQRTLWRELTPP